jgi:hypothetical protein
MSFPLRWPDGQKRRLGVRRENARFKISLSAARDHLINELKLLGARNIVISSDLHTRIDGLPYANQRQPHDTGVAVYFRYDKENMVFACDKWRKVEHNIRAVGKTIEAIRGISRWGSTDMMKRAVGAFKELPAQPEAENWRRVLNIGYDEKVDLRKVKEQYRKLSRIHHADMGGNEEEMKRVNIAWEAAQRELVN